MNSKKFDPLVRKKTLTGSELDTITKESLLTGTPVEELLMRKGVPKHEMLICLSEFYGCPFIEYEEDLMVSRNITKGLDLEKMKQDLWFPLSMRKGKAEVIACDPEDQAVIEDIKKSLQADRIKFFITLPSDLVRIIENNQDINPGFQPQAGRTPLAKVRTFLAEKRSFFACCRTSLAKGRTGLAFLRTGISFIAIAVVLFRFFSIGLFTVIEALLFAVGMVMAIEGIVWYLPARKIKRKKLSFPVTESTGGTTVLAVSDEAESPKFARLAPVQGADRLREGWNDMSPVMRRRFLASDRTDLAEERTVLARYRTIMALARTGLAFTRTGIAFVGLGIALLRHFHTGPWTFFDIALISFGVIMAAEGLSLYLPGRHAGVEGFETVREKGEKSSIWNFVFPFAHRHPDIEDIYPELAVKSSYSPGIWATTGLALERTLLAERRNVMARLRTVMARSRTGLAFIRTGMSITAVGIGLLVYFGAAGLAWVTLDVILIIFGTVFIVHGVYWHVPAEKIKKQFPYCFGDMEIIMPDYGVPARDWQKVVFNHDGG
jgi:uncharacterized membrane protein YidH (DUF202 family)